MGNSQWEREWNGLHNWESRAHRLHEVIGTQHNASEEEGFPEIRHCCIFYQFFRTMSDNGAKQMKSFDRTLPSRRRHLSLARADIVRHKSGRHRRV